MDRLSAEELARLTTGATQIGAANQPPRLFALPDGRMVKLLRLKRFPLLSRLFPPALRFRRNALGLTALGIPTIEVEGVFHCPELDRQGVIYPRMEGKPLSSTLDVEDEARWRELADFVARLHGQGVYFRSLHLGNILALPGGGFGLIDILDLRLLGAPLNGWRRARNLLHLLRRTEHRARFARFGIERFIHRYAASAALSNRAEQALIRYVLRRVKGASPTRPPGP